MSIENQILDLQKFHASFQEHEKRFNELRGQVMSCARKIKMFMIIAEYKQTNTTLYCEPFWGWLQMEMMCPEILLSCYKFSEGLPEYISDFLKLIVPEQLTHALKKRSQLNQRVKALKKTTKKFKHFRDKRAAHIECVAIDPVTLDLSLLYNNLKYIDSSLNYLEHFLRNPHLITEEFLGIYKIEEPQDLDSLESYLDNDYAIRSCVNILNRLNT